MAQLTSHSSQSEGTTTPNSQQRDQYHQRRQECRWEYECGPGRAFRSHRLSCGNEARIILGNDERFGRARSTKARPGDCFTKLLTIEGKDTATVVGREVAAAAADLTLAGGYRDLDRHTVVLKFRDLRVLVYSADEKRYD